MLSKSVIDRLLPNLHYTAAELEKKYPSRNMKPGAIVTRFAPSPTGFMHIGSVFSALVSERIGHQSGGVFFVRLEDTDQLREVPGAVGIILRSLDEYHIHFDEGECLNGQEKGIYGPYRQSRRGEIYKTFVKVLLEQGDAYPCFCTPGELEELHRMQSQMKIRPGYYAQWAKWRDRPEADVIKALDEGKEFVFRFRSRGNFENKIKVTDLIKGDLELSDNDQDAVILKSGGLPTYHFAHVVDDHLMRTTHVIRGLEWVSSLSLHVQMFKALNWEVPSFAHFEPIYKMDGNSKRKLSKRHDPEANVEFYSQEGFPVEAVIEYLTNLANSSFEDWRKQNLNAPLENFPITFAQLSKSAGPLFDHKKLLDISRNVIGRMTADEVTSRVTAWAEKFNAPFAETMKKDIAYTKAIFGIERGEERARKDIAKWSDALDSAGYFYDDIFSRMVMDWAALMPHMSKEEARKIVDSVIASYQHSDPKEMWLEKLRTVAKNLGYAETMKEYKKDKEKYKGYLADVANVLRVLLTGKTQSPDLYQIMKVLGEARVRERLSMK